MYFNEVFPQTVGVESWGRGIPPTRGTSAADANIRAMRLIFSNITSTHYLISLPNPPITQEDRFAPNRNIGEPRNFIDGYRPIGRLGVPKHERMSVDVAECGGIVFECFELFAIRCRVREISGNDIVALVSLCFLLGENGGDGSAALNA